TWTTFTIYLVVGYILYYTFNIIYDLIKKPARVAGVVETLSVSDEVETIEVDDDDDESVVTPNNYKEQGQNISDNNINNLKKEVGKTETTAEQQEQVIPSKVDAEISSTGGVPLKDLVKQRRVIAFKESNKIPFAS